MGRRGKRFSATAESPDPGPIGLDPRRRGGIVSRPERRPVKLSRRALLTLAGLAGLGLAVPACRQMLMQILFSPGATPAPAPPPPANPFRAGGRSLVAMVRGDDVPRAVQRA